MLSRTTGAALRRKIFLSLMVGTLTFFVTNLIAQEAFAPQLLATLLAVFLGGITLVTLLLAEFEARLTEVQTDQAQGKAEVRDQIQREFRKINEATELFGLIEASSLHSDQIAQLVRYSTTIEPTGPPLVRDFAQRELDRVSEFLRNLGQGGDLTYEGEDRDWLLALTTQSRRSIDAISLSTVDAGGRGFVDGGLWVSDLGQRYLEHQRDAVRRGVTVRRIFIMDRPDLATDVDFRMIVATQRELGIQVRILDSTGLPSGRTRGSLFDFIVFDGVMSYEVTPATQALLGPGQPMIVNTRVILNPARVEDRLQRFADLWASAVETT